jgi:hypothetical protein
MRVKQVAWIGDGVRATQSARGQSLEIKIFKTDNYDKSTGIFLVSPLPWTAINTSTLQLLQEFAPWR